jgi:hypothetical protein
MLVALRKIISLATLLFRNSTAQLEVLKNEMIMVLKIQRTEF